MHREEVIQDSQKLLTYSEAAKLFGVSARSVARWTALQFNPLRCIKVGNVVRFSQQDIAAFATAHSMQCRVKTLNGIPQRMLPPFMRREATFGPT